MSRDQSNNRLVHMTIRCHDDDNYPWGGEPLLHDGKIVGMTTSAAYGFQGDKPVAIARVERLDGFGDIMHEKFELEIADRHYPVDLRLLSLEKNE